LVVYRGTAPAFDANTATSIGANDTTGAFPPQPGNTDSLKVRISDVASAGAGKSFTITGLGAADVADTGSYTVAAPAAFAGTVTPSPVFPGATVWIHRNAADPVFTTSDRAFCGTSGSNLAALTVDTSTIRPDSFKTSISDLQAANTYLFQFTRLGTNLLAERGSYVLPVGTWGGTATPSSVRPANRVVLRRGGGDPLFDADTRVYIGGIRTFIESFSTDTAVVAVPPIGSDGPVNIRISRMGAGQAAVNAVGALTNLTTSFLDPYDRNDQPNVPTAITADGNYYITLSGACSNGVPESGAEDCDDYFTITNSSSTVDDTVTVTAAWFSGSTDGDLLICDGARLANPPPNNVPRCGNFAGGADIFDCACNAQPGDGFALASSYDPATGNGEGPPEFITFVLPANSKYVIWVNMFDPGGAAATLVQLTVSGLK